MSGKAVTTPLIDTICVGGLSILGVGALLLFDRQEVEPFVFAKFLILVAVLNGPHFTASYRLLYSSPKMRRDYPYSSYWIPLALVGYSIFALYQAQPQNGQGVYISALFQLTAFYLAVHYTGQTWGMMATFSYLCERPFIPREKFILRNVLWCLCGWQIVWATGHIGSIPLELYTPLERVFDYLAVIAMALALGTLIAYGLRIKAFPPIRVIVPLLALCTWYLLLNRHPDPAALFWVQMSHSLQYLIFPMRVEVNRHRQESGEKGLHLHMLVYAGALIFASYILFIASVQVLEMIGPGYVIYGTVLISAINIHHFFIDGAVWKISNPEVRQDLFKHLRAT